MIPDMVWVPGGEFSMGLSAETSGSVCSVDVASDAQPVHRVHVAGFWIDSTEVTNAAFAKFIAATHYVTVAERTPKPEDLPGVPPELLKAGGLVFRPPAEAVALTDPTAWWTYVPGANWRHPEGPASSIENRQNYPVVQIAYEDAAAYAAWAGKRLPTEAEWERAARGKRADELYPWGNELVPGGHWQANIFQGHFPYQNTAADGFAGLAPVASFSPNSFGLYDVSGNVWEWCSDWYRPDTYAREVQRAEATGGIVASPKGPAEAESMDPSEPGIKKRVQRGGSFLCTDQYCSRYMTGSRGRGAIDTSSNHVGFRCVKDADAPPAESKVTAHF
ncbi:MAG TPA: formylglycine-generating enzyme family protein [Opitutaceae bacterium]|nr:formylglycine-generating enzyme family protein [Opitutaceae bacterium]